MVGILGRVQGFSLLVTGLILVLLQGLGGLDYTVLTWAILATGIGFALMEVSGILERIGVLVIVIFLAVVGIGGYANVPFVPEIWSAIAQPLMVWVTAAGLTTVGMLALEIAD
jgi:hypothetical protein